jgi:hypothetical protein
MTALVIVYFWLSCAASIVALAVIGVLLFVLTSQWRFDRKVRNLSRLQFRERARRTVYR